MNPEIENNIVNNDGQGGIDEDIDIEVESDDEEIDSELDESEDEYFEEIYSEILEAVNRNADQLQLLQMSFNSLKSELFDIRRMWYRRFFKEIEMANETIEQVEDELFELSD